MLKLSDYAQGAPIYDGKTSASPAFQRAFVDAMGYGVPLKIDKPGKYLIDQMLQIPHGLEMFGLRSATRLIHAPGMNGPVIFAHDTVGSNLHDFYVSGGIGQEPPGTPSNKRNNDDTNGYIGAEAYIGGSENRLSDVVFVEWNNLGAAVYGTNPHLTRCWGRATPLASYKPDSGSQASRDLGSTYAFITPATNFCTGLRMDDCGATGTRGPGIFVGGVKGSLWRVTQSDCHREYCPRNDDPGGFTSGGGQLALSPTWTGVGPAGNQQPQQWVIDTPYLGPSPSAPAASGLELNNVWNVDVLNPKMLGGNKNGIVVVGSRMVRVNGGTIGGTELHGVLIHDSMFVNVATGFEACNTAVSIQGACSNIDLRGSSYYANVMNVHTTGPVPGLIQ